MIVTAINPTSQQWFAHWYFPDAQTGVVLRGAVNGTCYRLAVDDADPAARTVLLEPVSALRNGDVVVKTPRVGLVLCATPSQVAYRVRIDDRERDNPTLLIQPASRIAVDDFAFGASGFGPVLTGRTNQRLYLVRLLDEGGYQELTVLLGDWRS
jgi:hypothetical protein